MTTVAVRCLQRCLAPRLPAMGQRLAHETRLRMFSVAKRSRSSLSIAPSVLRHPRSSPSCARSCASHVSEVDIDIDRVAYGFMASQVLFAGLELNIFDHISDHADDTGGLSIERLHSLTGVTAPRLQTLVTALTAIHALRLGPDGYSLSPSTRKFLVSSARHFYGDYLRLQMGQQFYERMGALPKVTMTGEAPDYAEWFSNPEVADQYTRAQHNGSMATAKQFLKLVDLAETKSILDIGGGSGAFTITLCRALPELTATVLELPEVCKTGEGFVAAEKPEVADRVTFVRGSCLDAWPVELKDGHDVVLTSYVSGSIPASAIRVLYERAFERLRPGGMLVVHDFMVDDSLQGPELAALWAAQHVTVNAEGVGLAPYIVKEAMQGVGFTELRHMEMIKGMTKLVIGHKPVA